jgi:superoxide dismutase, Fe-Mn family
MMNKFFLAMLSLVGAAKDPLFSDLVQEANIQKVTFCPPTLGYSYDALEPYVDAKTVEIHYSKHHKAYADNLTKALAGSEWKEMTMPELFQVASKLPPAIRNNAGGHWNHCLYFSCMTGDAKRHAMPKKLEEALIKNFGSLDHFRELFKKAGLERFGSGYSWLIALPDGTLKIISAPNQDNPLMDDAPEKGRPLLVCDVWEHAYYLKYQNRRGDYLDGFWNLVNWDYVNSRYENK